MILSRRIPRADTLVFCLLVPLGCRTRPPVERVVYRYPPPAPVEPRRISWTQPAVSSARVSRGQLNGLVVDEELGEPLFGAQLVIVGAAIGATTDSLGRFSLKLPPGRQSISVRRVGYGFSKADIVAHEDSGYLALFALPRSTTRLCRVTVSMGPYVPESAVIVRARDALTGQAPSGVVTVVTTDGAFRDSIVVAADSLGFIRRTIAPDRPGTYQVSMRADGYHDWHGSSANRPMTECASDFIPAVFHAWLMPK